MNKNIEEYKNEINNIKVDDDLKQKTIDKIIKNKQKNKTRKFIVKICVEIAAVFLVVVTTAYFSISNKEIINESNNKEIKISNSSIEKIDYSVAGIERINNREELEEILKNNRNNYYQNKEQGIIINDSVIKSETTKSSEEKSYSSNEYSNTNVQVENVDEADIVKTDGKYIYYLKNDSEVIEIVDLDARKVISKIKLADDRDVSGVEMFLHDNKLIVIENIFKDSTTSKKRWLLCETSVVIYNISDKENIIKEREVSTTGQYIDSRMIGDNLYFITNEYIYYSGDITLPQYKDTIKEKEYEEISCHDIYYLKDSEDPSYTLVTAVNIENNEKAKTKTFLGLGTTIYSSEENMYVVKTKVNGRYNRKEIFSNYNYSTDIFKFKLMNNDIELVAKGEVKGIVNNQFSMDEYDGYFRIATTEDKGDGKETNNVLVLNDKLEQVGSITGIEKGEKIYAVRFMKNIGYVVTFKQVDPLLVIDLKDPENPKIKGKLEIPGYSSYLHPYDENHIIGIGKNTEVNKHGGITTTGIKISMFNISDLDNPKEIFKTSIGKEYAVSQALDNHKAVLCSKEKGILAIPISINDNKKEFSGAIIYKIDLENNKFIEASKIESFKDNRYYNTYYDIERILYVGDYLYAISNRGIKILNMSSFENAGEIKFN